MVIGMIGDVAGGAWDAMNNLRRSIEQAGDRLQKASLALGKTFDQMNSEITPAVEGLKGSLDQRIGAAMQALNAGLQGNIKGVATLVNQQQLTGTAFQNTGTVMARLSQGLNATNDEVNKLSNDLREVAGEWGVSTDKLVNAIDVLKDTFPTQQLAGMGVEVNAAVASLTAQMPALGGEVASVMRMILDPSLKTEANLARLGIAGVREQLARARDQKEAEQILKNAVSTASNTITQFVDGDFFASIGIATSLFGEQATALTAINEQLGKRIKNEEKTDNYADTIEVIKANILVPLQRVLQTHFYPAIKDISQVLADIGERFAGALTKWIKKLDISKKGVDQFTDSIVDGVGSLAMGLQDVVNFFIDISNTALPRFKAALGSIILFIDEFTPGELIKPEHVGFKAGDVWAMKHDPSELLRRGMQEEFERRKEALGDPVFGDTPHATFGLTTVELLKDLKSDSDIDLDLSRRRTIALEEMNAKTLDPFQTTSDDFALGSAQRIQAFMGAILGQTPADQLEETNNILGAILMANEHRGVVPLTIDDD